MPAQYAFPADFVWGAATASYQVEGAVNEDGRGASIWDTFSHQPGRVTGDGTGDVSADHYHRMHEDVQIMKWLGLKAYRFSIAWPRIIPQGTGAVNEKGVDFYNRLIDELLGSGIEPWITLYHWDLPQTLQDRFGGWQSRECAKAFAEYATVAGDRFSDRVKNWFTTNEFGNIVFAGYGNGSKAPGLSLPVETFTSVRHHALLGHGMALQALRASARQPLSIGFAEDLHAPIPLTDSADDIAAASRALRNHFFAAAMLEGAYRERDLAQWGAHLPKGWEKDMPIIGTPVDFVGANTYSVTGYAAHDPAAVDQVRWIPPCPSHPAIGISWLIWDPDVLYWVPRLIKQAWGVDKVIISENGCCSSTDALNRNGEVNDTDRVMLLRANLRAAQRSVAEGSPLRGYFHWSLMDNFEWSEGYGKRFGLCYVNYGTGKRTPKLSAHVYRDIIARGGFGG